MKYLLFLLLWLPGLVCGQVITTVAGTGTNTSSGDGGAAISATISVPNGGVFDSKGNFYFFEITQHKIRKISFSGIITTVAGIGTAGFSGDGGQATAARLNSPRWVTIDKHNNLYISDGNNNRIRKVNDSGIISTIIGNGTASSSGDGGPATNASTIAPSGIAVDSNDNIYFAEGPRVRKIDITGTVNTVAGTGSVGFSGDGGNASSAQINAFYIFLDSVGNIFLCENTRIRKISASTFIISTIIGSSSGVYNGDSIAATAANISPHGIEWDRQGNMYIADMGNDRVRRVDIGGIIHTFAGTGVAGYSGDGGPADSAKIYDPSGIALDQCGNLFITCKQNFRIRKVTIPSNPSVLINGITNSTIGSSVLLNVILYNAGYNYSIKWYNKGILFATTTTPSITYTKTMCSDSITAMVYGCSDSALSRVHVVGCTASIPPAPFLQGRKGVTCYPNPAHSVLHVFSEEVLERVVITNLVGQVVYTSNVLNVREFVVPVEGFAGGVYFVKVGFGDGSVVVDRFVKE